MKSLINILKTDLQLIFRDKTLLFFALTPAFLILFISNFVPYICKIYPEIIPFQSYILIVASLQTSILYGFVSSFVILEEKDEQVIQAIRILPLSTEWFIIMRLLFSTCISFISAFLMIRLGGIENIHIPYALILSFMYALIAPIITLTVSTFAKNKVEGLALFKGVDLILLLPIVSFFLDDFWQFAFYIFPTFWVYSAFNNTINDTSSLLYFIIGIGYSSTLIVILTLFFKKKVFNR